MSKPFSEQLRHAVLKCGKTQYRVGVDSGIAHSIISRFLHDGAGMSLANIDKLCEAVGVRLVQDSPNRRKLSKRKQP